MPYLPRQGDIVWVDFDPQAGHEQGGRRPALVVSNDMFNRMSNLAMLCPITNTISKYPMHILLDARTSVTGEIMCEQAKCIDVRARNASFNEKAPPDIVADVIEIISSMIE